MKKLVFLFVLLLSVVSCSSDGEKQEEYLPLTVENIEGTWEAVARAGHTGSEYGDYQQIEAEDSYIYHFNQDLTMFTSDLSHNNICEGTYMLGNNEISMNFDCAEEIFTLYISSLTEKELIITRPLADESVKIKFLMVQNKS